MKNFNTLNLLQRNCKKVSTGYWSITLPNTCKTVTNIVKLKSGMYGTTHDLQEHVSFMSALAHCLPLFGAKKAINAVFGVVLAAISAGGVHAATLTDYLNDHSLLKEHKQVVLNMKKEVRSLQHFKLNEGEDGATLAESWIRTQARYCRDSAGRLEDGDLAIGDLNQKECDAVRLVASGKDNAHMILMDFSWTMKMNSEGWQMSAEDWKKEHPEEAKTVDLKLYQKVTKTTAEDGTVTYSLRQIAPKVFTEKMDRTLSTTITPDGKIIKSTDTDNLTGKVTE